MYYALILSLAQPIIFLKLIEIVEKLIEKRGHACVADNGDVMFDVEKASRIRQIILVDLEQLQAGARIEINESRKINGFRALENVERKQASWSSLGAQVVLAGILNVRQ